jgi:hypothetical protein
MSSMLEITSFQSMMGRLFERPSFFNRIVHGDPLSP